MIYFYELIVWPLQKSGKHAFDLFNRAIFDYDGIIGPLKLPADIDKAFQEELLKKFTPKPAKVKAIFRLNCYSRKGLDDIKEALTKGEESGTKEIPLHISIIAPPKYKI